MIDLHCHLLPGLDDGPPSIDGSIALARAQVDAGVTRVVATPHVDHRWNVAPRVVQSHVAFVDATLKAEKIELELHPGAEIALARMLDLKPEELDAVRLGDGPYLLVESPHQSAAGAFDDYLVSLRDKGEALLLAHPERCQTFHRQPRRLAKLVNAGVLTSITAGSLAGSFGGDVRDFSFRMLREGLVHNVASDSHDAENRRPGLMDGIAAGDVHLPGLLDQAPWLCEEMPAAILAGADLPKRPAPPDHGRRKRRRLLGG